MPSVQWNKRAWSQRHRWELEGDEWSGMAVHCGQPYESWKQALVDEFIFPYVTRDSTVLEIAPGHGRWTGHLLDTAKRVLVVDINQACIEACRQRFTDAASLETYLTSGWTVPVAADRSMDFVWSFDSFVHMDAPVVRGYLAEVARVLRPGGRAVIHHAGMRAWTVPLGPVTSRLGKPGQLAQRLAGQGRLRRTGNRSAVSRAAMRKWVMDAGLVPERQCQSWGDRGQYDVRRFGDWITVARKPREGINAPGLAPRSDQPRR
jgi:ubiquinone/menaquinone biosynthesis C-methylase UbiE